MPKFVGRSRWFIFTLDNDDCLQSDIQKSGCLFAQWYKNEEKTKCCGYMRFTDALSVPKKKKWIYGADIEVTDQAGIMLRFNAIPLAVWRNYGPGALFVPPDPDRAAIQKEMAAYYSKKASLEMVAKVDSKLSQLPPPSPLPPPTPPPVAVFNIADYADSLEPICEIDGVQYPGEWASFIVKNLSDLVAMETFVSELDDHERPPFAVLLRSFIPNQPRVEPDTRIPDIV